MLKFSLQLPTDLPRRLPSVLANPAAASLAAAGGVRDAVRENFISLGGRKFWKGAAEGTIARTTGADAAEVAIYQRGVALRLHGGTVRPRTAKLLCNTMLTGKLGRVSTATYDNARTDYNQFLAYLGRRADEPCRLITRADIKAWVDARRAEVRYGTVRKALGAVRAAFEWAVDAQILNTNPCTGVRVPPDTKGEKVVHEAFTLDEVRLLLDKLPDEWASAVRCCLGTYGQRLGDILALKWEAFDWQTRTVHLITGKTARELHQPMQPDFYAWALARYEAAQKTGGEAAIYVHPTLRRHTNPSAEFTQLVRLHNIGLQGKNLAGSRRTWHSKTFHSLRATVATMLQASGVSQGLAMELVGHDSAVVHAAYIRPTTEQLRAAAAKLPRFS